MLWGSLPFIDRVGIVFLACIGTGMLISHFEKKGDHPDAIDYREIDTSTSSGFNLASLVIILMLAGLYIAWW